MDRPTDTRLLELLDRQDIEKCLVRYCRGIDRLDKELLLSAYHPDALDDHGIFVGSPTAFWDYFATWHATYNKSHHHSISNTSMEIKGDTAHTETHFLFQGINTDDSMSLSGGRYVDRFENRNGQRKLAARACIVEWAAKLDSVQIGPEAATILGAAGAAERDKSDCSYERPLRITRAAQADPY